MVISADTSFLFSLYGNDSHTPLAVTWSRANKRAIRISCLNHFELANSLRFAEFRKAVPSGQAIRLLSLFMIDLEAGRLIETTCNLADILSEATRLSTAHTITGGHRGFDILHVAAARIMGATHFLTFDANQNRLAKAAGLKLPL
jgi:predicted nucleic acid-binding protein